MITSVATPRLEHVVCNLCGADDPETVYEARHEPGRPCDLVRTFRASGDELLTDRLVRCRQCGLEYVNPRPSGGDIVAAYAEGDDPAYVSQVEARQRTFNTALARIENLQPRKGRLLDVGTAAGAFLGAAKARGWEVEGCEPNRWMAEWGSRHYGVVIRAGELFDQEYPPRSFDVVTLWDVVEHTPDPASVVRRISELLKPGGLLIINYPDRGSWVARLLGRRWPFLSAVHLFYFKRATLTRMLEDHGFEVAQQRPHFQWLELDYLLRRGEAISAPFSRWSRALARGLGIARRQVPYWIGQTFLAAYRKHAIVPFCHLIMSTFVDSFEVIALTA
jgi:2-polyprenyl-3-methyl-5-hydroxy-6-metoxy-1,4-benzoquinol methylase